ncbi:MAG: arginine decarboxylase, pyruvoyl-dependent [Nanoarchaeota archaeon]|nr:arginine decarboxylase, pyruvoyl-dependent [Nanoarchaeota archaeon]
MYTNIPATVFLTKGVGRHKDKLASFELALRDAGIEGCNLVYVSSILPPNCKIVSKQEGVRQLSPGQITFCVMARCDTDEANRLIASSIGCAVPADENAYGYLSEHHGHGSTDERAGEYAEDMAATMLATTLGIEFESEKSWDEREQLYKSSGKIIKTRNITQSAEGRDGMWTTVIAAAVFSSMREESIIPKSETNSNPQEQFNPVQ